MKLKLVIQIVEHDGAECAFVQVLTNIVFFEPVFIFQILAHGLFFQFFDNYHGAVELYIVSFLLFSRLG